MIKIVIFVLTLVAVVASFPSGFMRQPTQTQLDAYAKAEANKYTNVREPGVPYFDMRVWKDDVNK